MKLKKITHDGKLVYVFTKGDVIHVQTPYYKFSCDSYITRRTLRWSKPTHSATVSNSYERCRINITTNSNCRSKTIIK